MRIGTVFAVVLAGVGAMIWAGDTVTLQGERTIYTATCQGGTWTGERCSGQVMAGNRYRFRALRSHREVLFWTVGKTGSSDKFVACDIQDGRNWQCPATQTQPRSITYRMDRGAPVFDASVHDEPVHVVTKWQWWWLKH